jgi:hypothetical protein
MNLKVHFVQHKDDNYGGTGEAVSPLRAMLTTHASMEDYFRLVSPQSKDMLYTNNAYGVTGSLALDADCLIKADASYTNAPLFDKNYRILKSQTINNINPGDVVELCTKQAQNINFTKEGDFVDYDGNDYSVSKRPVFLLMEIVGRKDTVCYKYTAAGDVREFDTRTAPVNVGFDQTMEFTNFHTNNVGLETDTDSTYIKTYENFKQQTNVSVLGSTPADEIATTETDGFWTVPTSTEVTIAGSSIIKA